MERQSARVQGRFTMQAVSAAWLRVAAEHLRAIPGQRRFSASVTLRSDTSLSIDYHSYEAWSEDLERRFDDAVESRLEVSAEGASCSLMVRHDVLRVELAAWAATLDAVRETRDGLVAALGLTPLDESTEPQARRLGRRQEFIIGGGGTSKSWLATALDTLAREFDVRHAISGRCKLNSDPSAELLFQDWDAWRDAVVRHFDSGDLASMYLWAWEAGDETLFECDIARDLVTIQLTRLSVDDAMARLAKTMRLETLTSRAYQRRRYTRLYELSRWTSPKDFLAALDRSIALAFPKPPAVADAHVTRGTTTLDRDLATNLDSFRELVTDAGADLSGLYVVLEGSGGRYLGMGLDVPDKRFELWTSLGRSEWQPIARTLEDAIEIELKEEKSDGKERTETWHTSVLKMLATAVLASGGTYCTTEGVQLWMSHPRVTITSPPVLADRSSSPRAGTVLVAWTVTTDRWKDERLLHPTPNGSIMVRDESGQRVVDTTNVPPGTAIIVPSGDYDLTVTIDSLRVAHRITMHVKDVDPSRPAPPAPARAGTRPAPR